MRGFTKLSKNYFDKYSDKPVIIKKFDPKSRIVANNYIQKIRSLLDNFKLEILLRGSTAFGIDGKGEIEIGIYPKERDWLKTIDILKTHFGRIGNLEKDYARFNDFSEGFEIEIILLKGHDAFVDKKLTEYLKNSPEVLRKYEELKYKYAYSKRKYMVKKNDFLEKIVSKLH